MGTTKALINHALEQLTILTKFLTRSYNLCKNTDISNSTLSCEQYDAIEAFTSRYAHTVDFFVNRILRMLDKIEFIEQGTMLDIINRAQKRGIIHSPEQIRNLKDLRNRIAHEYSPGDQLQFLGAIIEAAEILLKTIERAQIYCTTNVLPKL